MQSSFKAKLRQPLQPVARWLHAFGAKPNHLTLAGLVASLLAGISVAAGNLTLAIIWLLIGLLCDMLDGDLARLMPAGTSRLGAFLDSCTDRVSEAVVFGGVLIGMEYHGGGVGWAWLVAWVLAVTGSFMVSYARARAEGLKIPCTVGFAERPERMVLLLLLLIFGFRASGWFLLALAVISWITVYQRTVHVVRAVRPPHPTAPVAVRMPHPESQDEQADAAHSPPPASEESPPPEPEDKSS